MSDIITDTKPKNFWNRPEGIIGLVPPVLIAGAIFWFWGLIVPFVLAAAEETLNLIVVGIAIFAILFVLFDKSFRNMLFFMYRALMRKVAGFFVDMDPIGILKTILEKAQAKKQELEQAIGDIRGQRIALSRSIEKNEKDYNDSMAKLSAAKKRRTDPDQEKQRQAARIEALESKQVTRLSALLEMQHTHLQRYDFVVQVLSRYGEVCEDTMTDARRDIDFRKQERDQSRAFSKGMRAISGILRGSAEDFDMQDMANEALEREYTQRLGEVENILDLTKNQIVKADFNDTVAMEKADELLNKWKSENSEVQIGKTTKQNLIAAAEGGMPINARQRYSQAIPVAQDGGDDYGKLLG